MVIVLFSRDGKEWQVLDFENQSNGDIDTLEDEEMKL